MALDPQLQFAAELMRDGRLEEAKLAVAEVIKANAQNADAWYLAALLMDNPQKQTQALERVLALNPAHTQAKQKLSALKRPGAKPTPTQSKSEDYLESGILARERGEMMSALNAFTQAIQLDHNSVEAYLERGALYEAQNEFTKAVSDYQQALALNPQHPKAKVLRKFIETTSRPGWTDYLEALVCIDNRDYSMAITHLNQAVRSQPREATFYLNRARAYHEKGNVTAALADFDKAIRLNPKLPGVFTERGKLRSSKGDPGGAISDFTQALKVDPMDALAYVERGRALASKNNHRSAIVDFTKAIDLDSSLAQAYACRGLARLQVKDVDGASGDYEQAIALEPAQRDATELAIKIEKARQRRK